jgi:hypothetical protein
MGSERSFGLVFTAVFALIGIWPWLFGGVPRLWALGLAAVFLGAGLVVPDILRPLNRLWFIFGLALNRVTNPVIMGLVFFGAFVPFGLLLRARGRDLLNLHRDPLRSSYWIERIPPAPKPGSMSKQF